MVTAEAPAAAARIAFVDLQAQRARLGQRLHDAVARVIEHGHFIMGPEVARLETRLAEFTGARHCVTCANGTEALALPLMARGIGPGDAVFVPAFTFVATAEVVAWTGATPVFVDVLPTTFNLDPDSLEAAIAAAPALGLKPRAVIPVDLFGQPADYRRIAAIARTEGLFLLADAAQSFGGSLDGKRTGNFGDATATSFFPAKPLGCYGDGGAIFTEDDDLAGLLRSLRVHGQGSDKYDNVRVGLNARLDTIQAAILLEKLDIFEEELAARQTVADRYGAGLRDAAVSSLATAPRVITPQMITGATSAWAQYTIRLSGRDALAGSLKAAGIPTAIYYPIPLPAQTGYRQFPTVPGGTPVAERLSGEVLSLPMHPYLDAPVQERIIGEICRFLADGDFAP